MALKILLADDSMTAQNMGKKILVDAGYDVVAVSNGAAAIKKISSEHPDIAILDEYMPGYTGSEVCERVKASAETAKIPVLLTVGKMEAFDPEKANKVRADGVMIKPFEASDLIAAVQSIAQRLLAPNQPRSLEVGTVQLRQAPGTTLDDTLRIPPPVPSNLSHEDTLRLTVQEIKAFQDASYHDWKETAEPHLEEDEKPSREMAVTPELDETQDIAPAMPAMPAEPEEPAVAAAMAVESHAEPRETPVFNAMAASGVAAEHEIFATPTTPVMPVEEHPATAAAVFYTPPVLEEEPVREEAPAFAVHSEAPETEPVVPAVEAETAVMPELEPAIEASPVVVSAPEVTSVPVIEPVVPVLEGIAEPVVSVVEEEVAPAPIIEEEVAAPILEPIVEATPAHPVIAAPVLETSAPLTPGPMSVAPVADLEPTIAPPVDVTPAAAHELEITSPPQEHGAAVAQDAALVTETEDMSQFATKFGVENAEPVHVGMVSDLTPEQLAAITTPIEEPAVAESVYEAPAAATSEVAGPTSPIEEEIGHLEAVEPAETEEPIVAYVPAVEEIEEPVATTVQEPEPEPTVEPVQVIEAAPVVEEPAAIAEVVAAVGEPEPEPVAEPTTVAEVEEPVQAVEAHASESKVMEVAEAAVAAAAGAAAFGVGHVLHTHATEPTVPEAVAPAVHEPQPMPPVHEPFGDAALAEELAAALSKKEAEERAKAAADAASAAIVQPAAVAAVAPVVGLGSQTLSDSKLADAVARAFENLKPQLITEIIKELSK